MEFPSKGDIKDKIGNSALNDTSAKEEFVEKFEAIGKSDKPNWYFIPEASNNKLTEENNSKLEITTNSKSWEESRFDDFSEIFEKWFEEHQNYAFKNNFKLFMENKTIHELLALC